jgi:hypothetical protein
LSFPSVYSKTTRQITLFETVLSLNVDLSARGLYVEFQVVIAQTKEQVFGKPSKKIAFLIVCRR